MNCCECVKFIRDAQKILMFAFRVIHHRGIFQVKNALFPQLHLDETDFYLCS